MNLVYMKTKIYLGILSLVLGLSLASCSEDDDYTIHTTPILNESSVVTGSSDVTATTATLHATLSGLDGMDAGSYKTGFFYGFAQDNLHVLGQVVLRKTIEEAIRPASSMVLRKTTCPRTCRLLMTAAPSVLS